MRWGCNMNIEKLKILMEDEEIDMSSGAVNQIWGDTPLVRKINELVDAVNSLRDDCNLLMGYIAPEDKCEPTISKMEKVDQYAEQRKWIGCVCKFWFDNPNHTALDYLEEIKTGKNGIEYYSREIGDWFPHCEPVKPDDDIIYKGGKDE